MFLLVSVHLGLKCKPTHLHDSRANLLAQDSFEGSLIDADKSHTLRLLLQHGRGDLHADEAGPDDNNVRVLCHERVDGLGVLDVSQGDDALEVRAGDRNLLGLGSRGENEVVVLDRRASGRGDGLGGRVDLGHGLRWSELGTTDRGAVLQCPGGSRRQSRS
jgi:hypothetical protein